MTNLSDKVYIGAGANTTDSMYSNDEEWVQVTYDFSADAGATGDYEAVENENTNATINYVVTDYYGHVETAVTSGGSPVTDLGIGAGGTEFHSDLDLTSYSAGDIFGMDTAAPVAIDAGEKLVLGLETATFTAGKVNFNLKLKRR